MHTDYRKTAFTLELNILTLVAISNDFGSDINKDLGLKAKVKDLVPEATDTHQT